ncbi:MAG: glycosyltransferase family 4 protein [Verrucomicrobia bacterium]|nr:glycosyltransferase family 4 protein [Verrucomicrobiota bacterium]
MKILGLCQNYAPEEQNFYHHELTTGLLTKGHDVTMLTAFPHYGKDRVYDGYRGKVFQREVLDGVKVIRTWVYATSKKKLLPRLINFGSFCASSLAFGMFTIGRKDVVYTSIPPLPLGLTGFALAKITRARLVVSVQDIFPLAAVQLGVLTNRRIIRFFEKMEKWVYRRADHIVVISEGFRQNLISKGVSPAKISVVSNWADTDFIKPGSKDNSFRKELNVGTCFTLIYSGGLTHNSNLEPVIYAADILRHEPFAFVIIGEGIHKSKLQKLASEKGLVNLQFRPFVPRERYPEVLLAADMNLVTLNSKATFVSVPSKIYKQMAAGRPIMAICSAENELARLVTEGQCGLLVPPDEPDKLVESLRWAASHPEELVQMGINGRRYLVQNHNRACCVERFEAVLQEVAGIPKPDIEKTRMPTLNRS